MYNGYTNFETWQVCHTVLNVETIYLEAIRTKKRLGKLLDCDAFTFVLDEKLRCPGEDINWQEVADCINSL